MRGWSEADDLAQETFIQVYCKLAAYDSQRSFRNWLAMHLLSRLEYEQKFCTICVYYFLPVP